MKGHAQFSSRLRYVTVRFLVHLKNLDEAVRYMAKWKHFVTSVLLNIISQNVLFLSYLFVCRLAGSLLLHLN